MKPKILGSNLPLERGVPESLLARVLKEANGLVEQLGLLKRHSSVSDGGWTPLEASGRFHQRAAWRAFEVVRSLGAFALGHDVPARGRVFLEQAQTVASAITLDDARRQAQTNHMNRFEHAQAALEWMLQTLGELPQAEHGMPVFVPDTNVLIELSLDRQDDVAAALNWDALRGEWFAMLVVIVPQVVKELDRLKYTQHGKPRGTRAQTAIRHLNDMWRRPRTLPAIPVSETVQLELLLTEPSLEEFALFPWLDPSIGDHRILLSALDAARRWPRDRVMIATNDLSMKLLAGYAGVEAVSLRSQG